MSSFTAKNLRITLILTGENAIFPGTNSNTLVLDSLRCSARVKQVANQSVTAEVKIFGMKVGDMNALTVVWANPPIVLNHLVIIEANNGDGYVQVFSGTMIEAQPNYKDMPNVSFEILAITGYVHKINATEPTSYPAATNIHVVASNIVNRMNLIEKTKFSLIDDNVVGSFAAGAYFSGTLWEQLAEACAAVQVDFYIQNSSIILTPRNKARNLQPNVVLRAESGLIGYPSYERAGLIVNAMFNPAFLCGTPIIVESVVPSATGRWFPIAVDHALDSRIPKGQWQSQLQCLRVLT